MKEIFHQRGLKRTAVREAIVELLQRNLSAMDVEAIFEKLNYKFDRATIYRTMKVLEESGFVHKVMFQQKMYYAVGQRTVDHAHFHCSSCGRVECMDDMTKGISCAFPEGYKVANVEVVFLGTCNQCNSD